MVKDESLDAMQVLGGPAGGLEAELRAQTRGAPRVAHHLHVTVLLHPQPAHDDVVHAAVHVTPRVRLSPPAIHLAISHTLGHELIN